MVAEPEDEAHARRRRAVHHPRVVLDLLLPGREGLHEARVNAQRRRRRIYLEEAGLGSSSRGKGREGKGREGRGREGEEGRKERKKEGREVMEVMDEGRNG